MARKRHSAEQIIEKLRIAEVETAKGMTIGQVCKKIGIAEQTYYYPDSVGQRRLLGCLALSPLKWILNQY